MSRARTLVGEWGVVKTKELSTKLWEANAQIRLASGGMRRVRCQGPSAPKASAGLVKKMKKIADEIRTGDLVSDSTFAALFALWCAEKELTKKPRPQTLQEYRRLITALAIPAIGKLRLNEITVAVCDRLYQDVAANTTDQARNLKSVLRQIFSLAVRRGAMAANPMREIESVRREAKDVEAPSMEDLETIRHLIDKYRSDRPHGGPRQSKVLSDVVDLILGTSGRIGEVLAFRWVDIDLGASPCTVSITGTIVHMKGRPVFRQDAPKSHSSIRTIKIPEFAADVLRRRWAANPNTELVFETRNGTPIQPNNVRRNLRKALEDAQFQQHVSPHAFRRIVATLLADEFGSKVAADTLGHANEDITRQHYIVTRHLAPDSSLVLQRFGPGHTNVDWAIEELSR